MPTPPETSPKTSPEALDEHAPPAPLTPQEMRQRRTRQRAIIQESVHKKLVPAVPRVLVHAPPPPWVPAVRGAPGPGVRHAHHHQPGEPARRLFHETEVVRVPITLSAAAQEVISRTNSQGRRFPRALQEAFGALITPEGFAYCQGITLEAEAAPSSSQPVTESLYPQEISQEIPQEIHGLPLWQIPTPARLLVRVRLALPQVVRDASVEARDGSEHETGEPAMVWEESWAVTEDRLSALNPQTRMPLLDAAQYAAEFVRLAHLQLDHRHHEYHQQQRGED
jgi:hypothetical protein